MARFEAKIGDRVVVRYPRNNYKASRYNGMAGTVESMIGRKCLVALDFPPEPRWAEISVAQSYLRPTKELPYD